MLHRLDGPIERRDRGQQDSPFESIARSIATEMMSG